MAVAVVALLVAALLVACGSHTNPSPSPSAAMPHLATSVRVAHDSATVKIAASGFGSAFAGLTLTSPGGSRGLVMSSTYKGADSGTYTADSLTPGTYTFTLYAVPARSDDPATFPIGDCVPEYVVATNRFAIP